MFNFKWKDYSGVTVLFFVIMWICQFGCGITSAPREAVTPPTPPNLNSATQNQINSWNQSASTYSGMMGSVIEVINCGNS